MRLLPEEKHTHIWHLQPEFFKKEPGEALLLSEEELERVKKIKVPRVKQQFTIIRQTLRTLLSEYTGIAAQDIQFSQNPYGKPELASFQNPHLLNFNLSHTHGHCMIAFACNAKVGIDIEMIKNNRDILSIAKRFYHPSEYDYLEKQDADEQHRLFYQYWTCKEAILKAIGAGLQYGLDKIIIEHNKIYDDRFSLETDDNQGKNTWEILKLQSPDEYLSAVALEGAGWTVDYKTF